MRFVDEVMAVDGVQALLWGLGKARKEANNVLLAFAYFSQDTTRAKGKEHYLETNALDHALVSAYIAYKTDPAVAEAVGNLNEVGVASEVPADSWKDQWNNAVGRKIGEFAKANNL